MVSDVMQLAPPKSDWKSLRNRYTCPCDESSMYDAFLLPQRAEGIWVWMEDDPEPYMDAVMGYSSLNFGHCHPEIVHAVCEASTQLAQIHSFHTTAKLKLSQFLSDSIDPENSYQVYFDVGGTSVVAAALRLARAYTGHRTVISFEGAFHGANYLSASVTDDALLDKKEYGIPFAETGVVRLPFPAKHGSITTDDCVSQLELVLQRTHVAAIIVEPIQGAGGFVIPHDDFLPRLREVADRYGAVLILDEIQVGLGRAGYMYSFQHWDVKPDVTLLSKSLAGGYYPLSALIARPGLFARVSSRATAFQSTFNNNPFALHIAVKTMELFKREDILASVDAKGRALLEGLNCLRQHSCVQSLRGLGLAIAFDITEPNCPNLPSRDLARELTRHALDEHLIIYSSGVDGNTIKLIPPLVITDAEIHELTKRIQRSVARLCS